MDSKSDAHDADSVSALQAKFAHFARHEVPDDPLYAALADAAASDPRRAALLAAAPVTQQLPVLWFAALQDRVLELADEDHRPPFADYYASAGGGRAPDADLSRHLDAFLEREAAALRERISTRTTQTNEIGRCAVLWPILRTLAARSGNARFALLDVGSSAGLNLGVDRWRYRYVDDVSSRVLPGFGAVDATHDGPEIACRVLAGSDAPAGHGPTPRIESRLGIDLNPVDVHDPVSVRWLRACLWPHDAVRRERFDAAVAIARSAAWPVRAVTDAADAIDDWLAGVPRGVQPVVFNSWVLAYFDDAALARHVDRLLRQVAGRGVAWISAEPPATVRRWWPALPAPQAGAAIGPQALEAATAWTVARPDGRGGVAWWLAARSQAHGRWLQWTA